MEKSAFCLQMSRLCKDERKTKAYPQVSKQSVTNNDHLEDRVRIHVQLVWGYRSLKS